jgi:hypothetical protein
MGQGDDRRERERAAAAYRAHLREMTAARQAAERAMEGRSRDPAAREAKQAAYRQELGRIAEAHRAWLRDHGLADPPEGGRHRPEPQGEVPSG